MVNAEIGVTLYDPILLEHIRPLKAGKVLPLENSVISYAAGQSSARRRGGKTFWLLGTSTTLLGSTNNLLHTYVSPKISVLHIHNTQNVHIIESVHSKET